MEAVANVISSVIEYAVESDWNDSDAIDLLVGMGIDERDFIDAGFGDFVVGYFHEGEEW